MIRPETLIEVKVESSQSLLPGRAGTGLRMLSPWQTGVQQCTPGMCKRRCDRRRDLPAVTRERRRRSRRDVPSSKGNVLRDEKPAQRTSP